MHLKKVYISNLNNYYIQTICYTIINVIYILSSKAI